MSLKFCPLVHTFCETLHQLYGAVYMCTCAVSIVCMCIACVCVVCMYIVLCVSLCHCIVYIVIHAYMFNHYYYYSHKQLLQLLQVFLHLNPVSHHYNMSVTHQLLNTCVFTVLVVLIM